jgi:8-oxo-dGTP pyrophosphatase MutT (NUDIX family)
MTDLSSRLSEEEREKRFRNMRPRDAATLILIDRSGQQHKVLMGRRHGGHKFMPGKFVFPGGRVEPYDSRMPAAGEMLAGTQARLLDKARRPSAARARAIALAAIRETCEETGLLIGRRADAMPTVPNPAWQPFATGRVVPDLESVHFIARAITPPGRPRRFDTRFFAADAADIVERTNGVIGPDSELTELVWVPLSAARELDLPAITHMVLDDLESRIRDGFGRDLPVPFYRQERGRFLRTML